MKHEKITAGTEADKAYSIHTDPATGIMTIVERGTWDVETAQRYARDFSAALVQARKDVGSVKFLFDTREFTFVGDDVAGVMLECLQFRPTDRFATVIGSTIAKLSAKRRYSQAEYGCPWDVFVTVDEARAWLLSS